MSGQGSLSYTIVISGAPYSSQAPGSALAFCRALIRQGHRIDRVFLYGEGVLLASLLSAPPSDEENLRDRWCDFLAEHQIEGIACIASALRRGVVDKTEQHRYQLPACNLASPFLLAGLGEWVQGMQDSDRVVRFMEGH
ncbi:MAG: sulfurtransferase complex subunit TusD [Pseudomonadota bacterium]|nr:sulfurtransferase complex subunit TusD [Pseudomonadota bacterium]